jgi:hypothetical protein
VPAELAYNAIKNAVNKNDFEIPIQDDKGSLLFTLKANDIFPGSQDATLSISTNATIQQSRAIIKIH